MTPVISDPESVEAAPSDLARTTEEVGTLLLEHLAMFPLIFLVMWRRRAEYDGSSHG